jgi:hypothetical protein
MGKSILGKSTSEKLNLLRTGPPVVNTIDKGKCEDFVRKYPNVFSDKLGKLNGKQLDLHINENVKPVAQPLRRLPFGLREKVDQKLDELLEKGVIEEVQEGPTEWVSPLVVVPKTEGDIRICVDMRRANEAIIRERHPIPTIEEVLYDMNGATVFSKLDLKWGFHQVEISEKSRYITTFVTHRGLYRYKRLMFGITSAPEQYQKVIRDSLQGCVGVANIADDLIVYGKDMEQHDRNLDQVLKRLESLNLTLNVNKCTFRMTRLTFFGHNLSKDGVSPSEEKIQAITNAKSPTSSGEIRSFLGLVQYCAKFIPNLAQVSEPLRRLTRKDAKFIWEKEQEEAFNALKGLLTQTDTLAYFNSFTALRVDMFRRTV